MVYFTSIIMREENDNMRSVRESSRFKQIENEYNSRLEDLLYQMHWVEDMKHGEMGLTLNVPRPTLTKWFHRFAVPTQSCRRFTDKNLTSWLYKTGELKKKPRYEGPDRRIQRTKRGVNVDFFKKWSPEMAYVMGYFCADGCMFTNSGGSKYISFVSTDKELLEKVKRMLESKHKIALRKTYNKNWAPLFLLQIGSKELFEDLIKLGFTPNKESRLKLPSMPKKYIRHFVRGYFDGDGSVIYGYFKRRDRNNKMTPYLLTCFAYANLSFLRKLSKILAKNIGTCKGYIDKRQTHLYYSRLDSIKLFQYMYRGVSKGQFLERKYTKFQEAFRITGAVA